MAVSNIGTGTTNASGSSAVNTMNSQLDAFRSTNFLQIILSEITNQDPLNPTETSKMVESMQSLQNLANSTYQKFRQDVTWAEGLTGKTVNVTQVAASPAQVKSYTDAGLNVDVGYGNVTGKVEGFRVVDNAVWMSIGGKDYPVDNVKQVQTDTYNTDALASAANHLLGMKVKYQTPLMQDPAQGVVSSVGFDSNGKLQIGVGSSYISYDDIRAITVPSATGG